MPLISIITVVYNSEKYIERTLQSIASQSGTDYEYIIIDGGSTDATLSIIEKYKHIVSLLISEPMNRQFGFKVNTFIQTSQQGATAG